MLTVYRATLLLHITAGLIGLVAFWTPALARKGETLHKRAGRLFFRATCVVVATGLMMAAMLFLDPLAVHPPHAQVSELVRARIVSQTRMFVPFLIYLLLITFVPVYHGVRVLATRRAPHELRTLLHTILNITTLAAAVVMIGLGIAFRQPVFAAMSPIGFLIGSGNLAFARRPYPTPMAWWYEHMGAMIGGGIAFHTAFLVLGAGRLLGLQFDGIGAVLTWITPTIIGVPASAIWVRYYRRKFGEVEVVSRPVEA
jgi:hypothetical protein